MSSSSRNWVTFVNGHEQSTLFCRIEEGGGDPLQNGKELGVSNKKGVVHFVFIQRGGPYKANAKETKGNKKGPIARIKKFWHAMLR